MQRRSWNYIKNKGESPLIADFLSDLTCLSTNVSPFFQRQQCQCSTVKEVKSSHKDKAMVGCSRFFVMDPVINFCMILHHQRVEQPIHSDPDFTTLFLIASNETGRIRKWFRKIKGLGTPPIASWN